jgi:hypothetical protein
MSATTCPACNGKRTWSEVVPETAQRTIFDAYPVTPSTGRTRLTYETGKMVTRVHTCELCNGRGTRDLDAIRDRVLAQALIDSDRARDL